MQHPDEGTIHAWLDGALSPEDAASVEAHVTGCPACTAAVAEARGFIAASSRILTALDNAPRGVIPAAAPRKGFDPLVWRIAALVLVVAAGTLVVVRNRGDGGRADAVATDSLVLSPRATAAAAVPAAGGVAGGPVVAPPPSVINLPAQRKAAVAAKKVEDQAASPALAPMAMAPVLTPTAGAGSAAIDRAFGAEPLRVIATPRQIGANVTIYEVDGDTVTLTESKSKPILESAVVTSPSITRQSTEKTLAQPKRMAASAAPPAAPDTQERRVASSPPAAATVGGQEANGANAVRNARAGNVITWSDPITGSRLTLSGRISPARLEQLKIRIERERAAAAAANKKP